MKNDITLILKAASFAADKHRGQRRKGKRETAYINHPLEVARILAEEGRVEDPKVIAAALLHDTIEDTKTTAPELQEKFGRRIAGLVQEVSDDKRLPKETRKKLQIENAPHKSRGASLIKIADLTANLRDLAVDPPDDWSKSRRAAYPRWANKVINALPIKKHTLKELFDQASENARRRMKELS